MPENLLAIIITLVIVIVLIILFIIIWSSRYKRCPSDKVLVIYGKVGNGKDGKAISAKCIHGGAAFIMPVTQGYAFLDLNVMRFEANIKYNESKIAGNFTVGISTEPGILQRAAERLLNVSKDETMNIARDIITGRIRILMQDSAGGEEFMQKISADIEKQLNMIGLSLFGVDITEFKISA